ncbi:hypothetical protein ACFQPF_16485 [Fictibacillus iocasae]|uniref:Uncharacterized protein n=1 Tax=Fictibacillus iocasae TaxID=2715437 RepID=A0ABW2NRY8_9BACL
MLILLAGISFIAVYYMSRSLKPTLRWSIWGAAMLISVVFLSILYVKSGTSGYIFWAQMNFLLFGTVSLAGTLYFIWFYYQNMTLPLKITLIVAAALLFSSAIVITHAAIPIFLYTPSQQ